MGNLTLNSAEVKRWVADNGDNTHNITYDLDSNSTVMDLGGYTGVWANQIIGKYNPNIYILEPIPEFYNGMVKKFENNSKVKLLNVGAAVEDKSDLLYFSGDGTSSSPVGDKSIKVNFKSMENILNHWGLVSVDLLQINIEGDEYLLLESMLSTGLINRFNNIQIQFHHGVEDDIKRRGKIKKGLENNGFKSKFDYPFVWESWYKL